MRKLLLGLLLLCVAAAGLLFAARLMWPDLGPDRRPALAAVPPLPELTRTSTVVAPVAVALTAIRDRLEAATPRDSTGTKATNAGQLLSNAEIGWTVTRGPVAVAGQPAGLAISVPLDGNLRLTGQVAQQGGGLAGALGNLLGNEVGRQLQTLATRALDQGAQIRGNVVVTSKPALTAGWRLQPNLAARVELADVTLGLAGLRVNVGSDVRQLLERTVNEQVAVLEERLRSDPTIEAVARREWAKMCRSIPLGAAGAGLPSLWLEVRPTRALAAQPRADVKALTLVLGVQAETRIVPTETKPSCPFPASLELAASLQPGRVALAVPIDVPFIELNRLLDAQLKGRTFPEDGSGSVEVTVDRARVAPSGDRLLISLRVKAREKTSFLGLGAEADVHVWGRPALDRDKQMLRLTDVALDVQSEAAFGLLGTAARAAMPYLETALAEQATIDLKPFAAKTRESIAAAIAEFRKSADAVQVEAAITDIRLTDIAFDARMLRVIAEAQGSARVSVARLP